MNPMKINEVSKAVSGVVIGDKDLAIHGVVIDTRKIRPGDLFVAMTGERTDGHDLLKQAREAGAVAALCEKPVEPVEGLVLIHVDSTIVALQQLATHYRSRFQLPVVAVTGSSGKTTTKNILVQVLSQKYQTIGTQGNKNNHIGMPLMVFDMDETTEVAVFEMGMSGAGEIQTLVQIAKPDMAVITNIGTAHMEQLGSRENILNAKAEILSTLKSGQIAVLNGDDDLLNTLPEGPYRSIRYGIYGQNLNFKCEKFESTPEGLSMWVSETDSTETAFYHFSLPGEHNVYNCLVSIVIGTLLGLTKEQVQAGLDGFVPQDNRMDIVKIQKSLLIDDTYNANPQSMKSALSVLAHYRKQGPIVAVLGDMLEMGPSAGTYHEEVGVYAADAGVDYLYVYGPTSMHYAVGARSRHMDPDRIRHFQSRGDLVDALVPLIEQGMVLLVKGSRGMEMDQIVKVIKEKFE